MKKLIYIFFMCIIFNFTLTGCSNKVNEDNHKIKVITTIFPLYDFTKGIAGDKADVKLILPPGIEPHSYEPKPRGIFEIRNSDIFIYTGKFMEPWASKIIQVLDEDKVIVVNSSKDVTLLSGHDKEISYDPHIWLNPLNAMIMVDNILNGLIEADPANEEFYRSNALIYKEKLQVLHEKYLDLFSNTKFKTIIFGGHFVLGYLANEYDLDYITPYKGFSPDSLPTPTKIQELINLINSTGQKYIFYEELINPKVAKIISESTGVKMLAINGGGNVSKDDLQNNVSYISIMEENINNMKVGLGYNE